jgi:hypothetical protein
MSWGGARAKYAASMSASRALSSRWRGSFAAIPDRLVLKNPKMPLRVMLAA